VLFKANVAASETYNTALEQHLRESLGVRFAERPGTDPAKRPIREIVGVDPRLNQRWSTRRAHINTRRSELATQFQNNHGRPATPVEALQLAQQATLQARDAKHEPRSLAEQRATWLNEAAAVLGGHGAVTAIVQTALTPAPGTATIADARWIAQTADHVLAVMEQSRSIWQMWHVRAEAQRQIRTADVPAERAGVLVDLLVDEVLDRRSVALAAPYEGIDEPEVLRRVDGSSVYTVAGSDLYTSQRILDAEQRLVTSAGRRDIPGLTTEPAWPTLRAHLLALAAETGEHPLRHMLTAASERDLRTVNDMAAVLDWRLPALTPADPGPLPWLPGIPATLHADPVWGPYLTKRSQLVADLAAEVQDCACQYDPPVWAPPGTHRSTPLIGEIAVWRAVNGINPQDPRPTGGTQLERSRRFGKHGSTGILRVPPTRQQMRGPTSDRQHAPHLVQGAAGSALTKHPTGV
jgi:uncharacterized protein YecT (DUF1311 family)